MPTTSSSLESFIAHARTKGMDHQTIRMLLLSSGWKDRDIAIATAEQGLDMPVPLPPDTGGARDAFFHLLTFAGLYTTVISFIVLAFSFINRWFPDPVVDQYATGEGFRTSIRWSLAALMVAFPIYGWISWFLLKEMRTHTEKGSSAIRRWLTYLTLFVAASVLIGDVITLVFSLLNGEVTVRFLCKAAVIFLVTGGCFSYYFLSLRRSVTEHGNIHTIAASIATVCVTLAVVYGLFLTGSPATERLRKMDAQRVQDIRTIAESTLDIVYDNERWSNPIIQKPLPKTLQEIADKSENRRISQEDAQEKPYTYSVLDAKRFQICSEFHFADQEQYAPFWDHPAGKHCYEFDTAQVQLP